LRGGSLLTEAERKVVREARRYIENKRPDTTPYAKRAFIRVVFYAVTKGSAYTTHLGGPSAREIVAIRKCRNSCNLEKALETFGYDDNIFGPLQREHYLEWLTGRTRDDDPQDVEVFERWRRQREAA